MDPTRLRRCPLFERLGKRELKQLSGLADEIDVQPGKVLATEGSVGMEFFVIEEGTAAVTRGGEHICDLGPGEFFGEMALIDEKRRTATVTASTPMQLILMAGNAFRALEDTMPSVYETVRDEVARRRTVAA